MPASPKLQNEIYFTLTLTENEHDAVEYMIQEWCSANGSTMLYYRKLKEGHIPMRRECKVQGNISAFLKWCKDNALELQNYPRDTKEADKQFKAGTLTFDEWYAKYKTA